MKKLKKIIILTMAITTLLGATLSVNAAKARNNWCHPGAADTSTTITHNHGPGTAVRTCPALKCAACGKVKGTCGF